ncbi:MAG: metallophosphoesterase [Xanthobacteraceae bacterium]
MYTILHLSDLHRSPEEPVNNDSLIAALLADQDRYAGETPVVPKPDAIIVSGDLIQGARLGDSKWKDVIASQYDVAGKFLDELTKRFPDGDRSRLIIIPGNHDVCWNTAYASMKRVAESEYPSDIYRALTESDSRYRWSWKDRTLFQIVDEGLYSKRLAAYWDFAEKFYDGAPVTLPIDRNRPFQLFELDERRIVIAAFDSTHGNDCFGYSGAIPAGAVARSNLHLRDAGHDYKLRMAVWHHSLQGPPAKDDYMDLTQVYEMTGLRFQLGMHGHQHLAAATTHYVYLGESQSMAVVSAGSLCAGSRELPRGVNRQYNVVVVNDDYLSGRVHVREMAEGSQFTRKDGGAFSHGYADIAWQKNIDLAGRAIDADRRNERRAIVAAEDALKSGNAKDALALLDGIELSQLSHARSIAMRAALDQSDWPQMLSIIRKPTSVEEGVWFVTALIKTGALDDATNSSPGSPYRGAGRMEATFTMDRVLDAVARASGLDPLIVRERISFRKANSHTVTV